MDKLTTLSSLQRRKAQCTRWTPGPALNFGSGISARILGGVNLPVDLGFGPCLWLIEVEDGSIWSPMMACCVPYRWLMGMIWRLHCQSSIFRHPIKSAAD